MEEKNSQCRIVHSTTNVNLEFEEYPPKNYNPLFFTKVNGAVVNQDKINAFIGIGSRDQNGCYNECCCTLEQGDKLGDFFDVLPHGIINKTITGIGATTLELNSKRNSIIVLPTKSIAYSKFKNKEKINGLDSCMYVGSPIGDITSDITIKHIKDYIYRDNGYKKFLVVADSLFKVLEAIGENNYKDYFLMVDEIDTLQIDNTYRPVLERVIDFYGKFKQTNRAAVSATLRGFTHPELLKETIITTKYPVLEKRNIKLIHSDNEDRCVVNEIISILNEDSDAKILIAYNSIESISICIKLLLNEFGENLDAKIGILCSEKSKDKADDYYIEIEDGELSKNIVFMTCAYFVGVDINARCHVISVSSFKKPFTLLSKEKLTQIVGRCRLGALSETIIYTTKNIEASKSLDEYKDYLLKKASLLINATNAFKKTLDVAPELFTAANYVEDIIKHVGEERVSNSSSIPIIRINVDNEIVPSYFNIDALLEKWTLLHELYKEEAILHNELINEGHVVTIETKNFEYSELQKVASDLVKSVKADKIENAIQEAKEQLLGLNDLDDIVEREHQLRKLYKNCILELKPLYDNYIKLSPFYESEYLINLLADNNNVDRRCYRRLINSLVFHALDDSHPFKSLVMGVFEYSKMESDKELGKITPQIKKEKMELIFNSYFKGYKVDDNIKYGLMLCFFKQGPTKKYFQVVGLNPMDFEKPINKIKAMDASELFKTFMFNK